MKVLFKSGSKIVQKDGLSGKMIKKLMEDTMVEHPHLCATCSSTSCQNRRGIFCDLVYSAVRTSERDYVFGCIAYRKRKLGEELESNSDYSISKGTYIPSSYSVVHPRVKEFVRRLK